MPGQRNKKPKFKSGDASTNSIARSTATHQPASKRTKTTEAPNATANATLASSNDWLTMDEETFDRELNKMSEEGLKALQAHFRKLIVDSNDEKTIDSALERSIRVGIILDRRKRNKRETNPVADLGAWVKGLGMGSNAASHKALVDRTVESLKDDAKDRKGRMLSHFLYREFLNYYYEAEEERGKKLPVASASQTENNQERYSLGITEEDINTFNDLYKSMGLQTNHGLVSKKNNDGKTPEACQTSFLGAFLNTMIAHKLGSMESKDDMVVWLSEYTFFLEVTVETEGGKDKEAEGDKQKETEGGKNKETEEPKKRPMSPRQDGTMAMRDPANGSVWRAILSYEAKLDDFDEKGKYESKSNAVDAISRFGWSDHKPTAKPWPLLVVRHVIPRCKFSVYAMSPDSPTHYKMVPMLTEEGKNNFLRAIMAVGKAAQSFHKKVKESQESPDFCVCGRNVSLQKEEERIFKSFVHTNTRKPHLELCQEYIGEDARQWNLQETGCYLELPYVGTVLPSNNECSVLRFSEIATTIQSLHDKGLVHGDIHLENCILGGDEGKLIDFDFVGKADEATYPSSLYNLDERVGGRHEDLANAIHNKTMGKLPMKKNHDWISFGKVMALFKPVADRDSAIWNIWNNFVLNQKSLESRPSSDFTIKYIHGGQGKSLETNTPGIGSGTGPHQRNLLDQAVYGSKAHKINSLILRSA